MKTKTVHEGTCEVEIYNGIISSYVFNVMCLPYINQAILFIYFNLIRLQLKVTMIAYLIRASLAYRVENQLYLTLPTARVNV